VNHGARVINLSIGGIRDPADSELDSFSPPEEAAVEYAYSKGVLVVAAVGNGTQTPRTPWRYADYPAALPHVLGVGAVREGGAVPDYSNRDPQFVDIAAPGGPIFSTIPHNLVDPTVSGCTGTATFSNCGTTEFRDGIGTSFAAPQVTSAAALLLGVNPRLTPAQLEWLLERSATDADAVSGCPVCPVGRDSMAGWGDLNVTAALNLLGNGTNLPTRDVLEPNDDAGNAAHPFGPPRTLGATLDYWDDPVDVYSIKLNKGSELFARLGHAAAIAPTLTLWKPGTEHVSGPTTLANRAAQATDVSGQQRLGYRVPETGIYFIEVKAGARTRAPGRYELSVAIGKPTT
jgi:subtilisin family serine protease